MARVAKWALGIVGGVLLLAAAAVLLSLAWIRSDTGSQWLVTQIEQAASSPDQQLILTGLSDKPPFDWHIQHIALNDKNGAWLTLDGAVLKLDPWALPRGTAHIPVLQADVITILRAPASSAARAPDSSKPFQLPHLPVAIVIDRLSVPQISIAAAVAGTAASLKLDGNLALTESGAMAVLNLNRLDAPGIVALNAAYSPATIGNADRLDLSLVAQEPSGNVLALIAPDQKSRPLNIKIAGVGPIAGWVGRLDATAGDDSSASADVRLGRIAGQILVSAKGDLRAAPLMPKTIRQAVGGEVAFDLAAKIEDAGPITLDRFRLTAASATVMATGRYEPKSGAISALINDETDLASLASEAGTTLAGQMKLDAVVSGTVKQPGAHVTLNGTGLMMGEQAADSVTATLDLSSPSANNYRVQATGQLNAIRINNQAVQAGLGDVLSVTVDATGDPGLRRVTLSEMKASGVGVNIDATGTLTDGVLIGHAKVAAADLSRFSALAGTKLAGSLDLTADASSPDQKNVSSAISGGLRKFTSGIAALNGALGPDVDLNAKVARDSAGAITLSDLKLASSRISVSATGRYDQAQNALQFHLNLTMPSLTPMGPAFGTTMDGAVSLTADASGTASAPQGNLTIDGTKLVIGKAHLDQATVRAVSNDLSKIAGTIAAKLQHDNVAVQLAARLSQPTNNRLSLEDLTFTGPSTNLHGALAIDLDTHLVEGNLAGSASDLSAWTPLTGTKMAGNVVVQALFHREKNQSVDAQVSADNVLYGVGNDGYAAGRVRLDTQLTNVLTQPQGRTVLDATYLRGNDTSVDTAHFQALSGSSNVVTFDVATKGKTQGRRFDVTARGDAKADARGQIANLNAFAATIEDFPARLNGPLHLEHHGNAVAIHNLDIDLGGGKIRGNADYDPRQVNMAVTATALPLGKLASLAGRDGIAGTGAFDLSLAGPSTSPRGRVVLQLAQTSVDQSAPLDVAATGTIDGRSLNFQGTAQGVNNAAKLDLAGSVPVIFSDMLAVSMPPDGPIRATLKGSGQLATLSQILPLGEDRVSGGYTVDLAVTGTVAAPRAGGSMAVANGRYDNAASGMTLRDLSLEVAGANQKFELRRFTATDGTGGQLNISGSVDLSQPGAPVLDIDTVLKNFAATRRDDVTATLSGTTKIAGSMAAPHVTGDLTINRANVNIPQQLPSSVPDLTVIRIDSRAPVAKPPLAAVVQNPFLATLDIKLHDHGQTFIRGDGLDSEWNGELSIGGTSSDLALVGTLNSLNGTLSVLGTSFTIERGAVTFTGTLDPAFDIVAQATTADVTAVAELQGTPASPKISLTSTPTLPQDEVLSRVMFGTSVSQITPTQGLQMAAAAAGLVAGGGPGVLDRVRNFTGLDRLAIGSDTAAKTSTSSSSGGIAAGTTVQGGKYVAPGVFVGVDQGLSGTSTRARVEVSITDHITLDAIAGASSTSGSSLGVSYKRDY